MGKYLNKPTPVCTPHPDGTGVVAGDWGVLFPALTEFLVLAQWEDGTPRAPGSVTVFYDTGAWKACLNDKDQARVAFVSGGSPDAALALAEAGLVGNCLDWRTTKWNGRKKG